MVGPDVLAGSETFPELLCLVASIVRNNTHTKKMLGAWSQRHERIWKIKTLTLQKASNV